MTYSSNVFHINKPDLDPKLKLKPAADPEKKTPKISDP
jgi:hypothetical protein